MRAVVLTMSENVKQFVLSDLPIPEPQPDEICIQVHAAAFNPSDYQMRRELSVEQLPAILGGEVAGIVHAVGRTVTRFAPGDAVYAYLPQTRSGYAEYVCVRAMFAAPKPQRLSFAQSAALPVVGLTAYECIMVKAPLQAGQAIFIAGGSGGVGTMAIQLARLRGASPIIVSAGGPASVQYLTQQLQVPHTHIIRYHGRSPDEIVQAAVSANGGAWYPIVLDCVGGAMTPVCCRLVDFDGHVISIVGGPTDSLNSGEASDEEQLFNKSATFHFVLLYARAKYGHPATWSVYTHYLTELTRLLDEGLLQAPQITDVGPLGVESVQAAHARLESGHVQGKLVMSVLPSQGS